MQRSMIQNITLVLCLESINMWIDMDNKIIEKIQNLLELAYDAPNDEEGADCPSDGSKTYGEA